MTQALNSFGGRCADFVSEPRMLAGSAIQSFTNLMRHPPPGSSGTQSFRARMSRGVERRRKSKGHWTEPGEDGGVTQGRWWRGARLNFETLSNNSKQGLPLSIFLEGGTDKRVEPNGRNQKTWGVNGRRGEKTNKKPPLPARPALRGVRI